ncbi:MAG: D-glycero-beta-D-manno-heptose 1-phosphate adenylyltransferase [Ignavibacteriae bacterium]|nr:D-glycero-beta-D-manno-heptose 1-phosphate adenylyltransferase [Ignavibacteriota bacterium]
MGKLVTLPELLEIRKTAKSQKKTVVFTNGCYDIIHRGHLEYFLKAKALGDFLVVGVNTDDSVRRIKGEKRPIVPDEDRAFIVANLSPVDYVCLFSEDTPFNLIQALVPDVLVKGADWKVDDIVGKDIVERVGGKVSTIEFVPTKSTSNIIEEILRRYR